MQSVQGLWNAEVRDYVEVKGHACGPLFIHRMLGCRSRWAVSIKGLRMQGDFRTLKDARAFAEYAAPQHSWDLPIEMRETAPALPSGWGNKDWWALGDRLYRRAERIRKVAEIARLRRQPEKPEGPLLVSKKLGRKHGLCEAGMNDFSNRTGIRFGHKGIPVSEFVERWQGLPERITLALTAEYPAEFRKVCAVLDLDLDQMQPEHKSGIEQHVLGERIGKPNYVSGKTAYIQEYEGGHLCVSYDTPVGFIARDGTKYRTVQRYSVTTSRHMTRFGLWGGTSVTETQLRELTRR